MVNMEMELESVATPENAEQSKRKVDKTILDNFSKLVNPHDHVRVKSGANIVKYLFENSETGSDSSELKYALKRLIRGLGSQSFAARAGYYSTLLALLNLKLDLTVTDMLELVKTELHRSGKNSDGENADICAGHILTCGAIIHANMWPSEDEECEKELLQLLINACKERTYLGLLGYSFLVDLLHKVPKVLKQASLMELINGEVAKPWTEQTLDTLYLLFSLKSISPKSCNKKFLKSFLGTSEIVCEENLEHLGNILMGLSRISLLKHPIYTMTPSIISPKLLSNFFNELDKHLKTPNRNRLLVFLTILTNTLINISENNKPLDNIESLLTGNLITQILGYFRTFKGKQRDKEYHDAVQKLFETLLALFRKETAKSDVKIGVIKKLLFDPGTFVFEKVTKSKIVQQITSTLDVEGVKNLGLVYRRVTEGSEKINTENESETWLNNDRLYSAHLLIKLLSLPVMKGENDWKAEQLEFLLRISLFRDAESANVGRELAESLKGAFYGALDLKLSKLDELQLILTKLVEFVDSSITPNDSNNLSLRNPLTEELTALWQKTVQTIHKIQKKSKKSGVTSVFLTLFLHMGLQLFNDQKLAADSLNELFSCYERVRKDKKAKKVIDLTIDAEDTIAESESDPHWLEVVIDLFLNLLSHNSHLLRSIIKSVFPHLCQFMSSTTIHQILGVLQNDENPLSKDENDDESSSDEDEDSENEESESGSEEEDNEQESSNDKLRMALHQVLSNGGTQSDEESVDLDQMSDTEGEKLDAALAEAFKQFKPNHGRRKKQTKDQETLTHFRVRVLDLVEIYLESNPSMLLTLEVMLPLLQAVEFSIRDEHQKPLNDRLKSLLKKLLGLKKFSSIDDVTDTILIDLLKSLLDKSGKSTLLVQEMGEQISDCCIFVVKCSEMLRGSETATSKMKRHIKAGLLEVLSGELMQFCIKRDSLTPYVLFKNLMQLSWEGNIGLAISLLDLLFNTEIRPFKKNQIAELLKIFYSNQRFFSQFKSKVDKKMSEAHSSFSSKVVQFFQELCQDPERKDIKERFVCHMFNLLSAIKHSPIDQSYFAWSDIGVAIREYRSYKSFSKDAKIAFNQLCKALGVSNIVQMKQKVTILPPLMSNGDEGQDKQTKETHKKRKRKSNETLKLKKEAKQLRLQSLSDGLAKVGFDEELALNSEENMTEDEEPANKMETTENDSTTEKELVNGFGTKNKVKKFKKKRNKLV